MKTASQFMLAGLAALLSACGTVTDPDSETRPVGQSVLSPAELAQARREPDFRKHVAPILTERCLHCHDGKEMPGKLDLSTRRGAFRDQRIIVPGQPTSSMLIVALTTGNHALSMPAVGTAPPPEEVAVLERWIELGAKWPEGAVLRARE